ncbi:hypothetical protein F5B18DRAFT_250709 [Nemania serpens]|nr:hypothetical protein F5B18DRAFT_250709 [Nemania serpens]
MKPRPCDAIACLGLVHIKMASNIICLLMIAASVSGLVDDTHDQRGIPIYRHFASHLIDGSIRIVAQNHIMTRPISQLFILMRCQMLICALLLRCQRKPSRFMLSGHQVVYPVKIT